MNRRVSLSPAFALLLCGLIWLDEDGLVPRFLLSAALHEAGHLGCMALLHIPVEHIQIGLTSAVISAHFRTARDEALSAAAGPAVNLLLALTFFRVDPMFSILNAILLLYNLLPIYPLDGGRLLRIGCVAAFGVFRGLKISNIIATVILLLLSIFCLYLTVCAKMGRMPMLLMAIFLSRLPIWACIFRRRLVK